MLSSFSFGSGHNSSGMLIREGNLHGLHNYLLQEQDKDTVFDFRRCSCGIEATGYPSGEREHAQCW